MSDFHMAQLRLVEIGRLKDWLREAHDELEKVRAELRDADREIKALRDELDYVHQERDDLERLRDES